MLNPLELMYNPICGVTDDFEKLLTRYEELKSINFSEFVKIWKDMSFDKFFAGRQCDKECREFQEECLRLASNYCAFSYPITIRIGGIFLLYGLYFSYPYDPKVKIRLVNQEWKELMILIEEITNRINNLNEDIYLDVFYIFNQLRSFQAFQFVSTKSPINPSVRFMSDMPLFMDNQKLVIQQPSSISHIFNTNVIDELSSIQEEYRKAKEDLCKSCTIQESSIKVIDENIVQKIAKIVASHEEWWKTKSSKKTIRKKREAQTSESEAESEQDQQLSGRSTPVKKSKSQGDIRAEIKSRAFMNPSTSKRHSSKAVKHKE